MQVQASDGPWSCAAGRGWKDAVQGCEAAGASLAYAGRRMRAIAWVQTQRCDHWMQWQHLAGLQQCPI
eukprot:13327449-Alexandrium_andersonii.AAC.1